jgi:hypothetical protein
MHMRSNNGVNRLGRAAWSRQVGFALVVLAVIGAAAPALAQTALPPNTQVNVASFTPVGGALLASLNSPFTTAAFTGSLRSAVVQNENNTLDFYYQVTNDANSLTSLGRETNFNFSGFSTSVFFRPDAAPTVGGGFVAGTETPDTADRDNGGVVGFNFLTGATGASGKIDPGETSSILVIRTDATLFAPGVSSVINGGGTSVTTFMPVIPEPASLGLLAAGAMLAMRRRR